MPDTPTATPIATPAATPAASISTENLIQQFQQQIDFFQQKLNLPTDRWDDIKGAAHDRAFIVAGAQKADLLNDLREAVDKAVTGGTFEQFRKDFADAVTKSGWSGWTGEDSEAGQAWRTRVIYQTNLRVSYAAGRWRQLNDPDLLKLRPCWCYVHSDGVLHPRAEHLTWNGLTLPHDHPFWQTHYPSILYDEHLPGWPRVKRRHHAEGSLKPRTETLWLSPERPDWPTCIHCLCRHGNSFASTVTQNHSIYRAIPPPFIARGFTKRPTRSAAQPPRNPVTSAA